MRVQHHLLLHTKFKACLGYTRLLLKKQVSTMLIKKKIYFLCMYVWVEKEYFCLGVHGCADGSARLLWYIQRPQVTLGCLA